MRFDPTFIEPNRSTADGIYVSYLSEEIFVGPAWIIVDDYRYWCLENFNHHPDEVFQWVREAIEEEVREHISRLSAHRRLELHAEAMVRTADRASSTDRAMM
ncbi:hypothetical protein [Paracoccus beibuensis]|uniref:hypothetical protein n=1 Tax=Paracoccus beibuensis TaxID=547602 RepID=UPI00223F2E2B|nr:hypothetical protein [Paracoccus beibuensis]